MAEIYVGLMSGTSVDSVDCATLDLSSEEVRVLSCKNFEIPKDLKKDIIQSSQSEKIEQELIDDLDFRMAEVLVESVKEIISDLNIEVKDIKAIGSHGQTIKHEPRSETPYTLQIGDPQKISNDLNNSMNLNEWILIFFLFLFSYTLSKCFYYFILIVFFNRNYFGNKFYCSK